MSYQFMGFRRPDGRVGARNLVGVIPSVTCANDVAQAIVTEVQGTVGYFHHQGCCQLPPDLDRVTETLTSLGQSPNLGAVLIVSLGCEGTDFEKMYKTIEATGKPVRIIGIQELGGVSNAIQKGIDLARQLVIEISGQQRQPASIEEVVMAALRIPPAVWPPTASSATSPISWWTWEPPLSSGRPPSSSAASTCWPAER